MKPITFLTALIIFISSCEKNNDIPISPLASLTVANVVINGKNLKLGSYARDSALINNFKQFGLNAGQNTIYLFPSNDSLHPYYHNTLNTTAGELYMLLLAGDATTTVDAVLIKEEEIPWYTDSTCAVRFANMSPDNVSVKVVLASTPGTAEFSSTAYKSVSEFKPYPATSTNSTYVFEIRDASTDALLGTYSLVTPRFHAVTLVWKGITGGAGANAPGILRVNNY